MRLLHFWEVGEQLQCRRVSTIKESNHSQYKVIQIVLPWYDFFNRLEILLKLPRNAYFTIYTLWITTLTRFINQYFYYYLKKVKFIFIFSSFSFVTSMTAKRRRIKKKGFSCNLHIISMRKSLANANVCMNRNA